MSTFHGRIEELPGVSVDRFDGENLSSGVYFLSHCHSDHTQGLDDKFFAALEPRNVDFYCSPLTRLFLLGKYNLSETVSRRIKELTPDSPRIIDYVDKDESKSLTVDCASAGHCPGSVMFVFEQKNIRILYTGDFRVSPADFPKLAALNHSLEGKNVIPRKFDRIYLDTTFCNPQFPEFPSRQASLREICSLAKNWLDADPSNVVSLECSALYGSEFLFIEIRRKLGLKVHVKPYVFRDYSKIPELANSISDSDSTVVHACKHKLSRDSLPCRPLLDPKFVLTIVPSAQRWCGKDFSNCIVERDAIKKNRVYVCCSMHSSYNELEAFVRYFQPTNYFPCVDPPAYTKTSAADFLANFQTNELPKSSGLPIDCDLSELVGHKSKKFRSNYFSDDSSD